MIILNLIQWFYRQIAVPPGCLRRSRPRDDSKRVKGRSWYGIAGLALVLAGIGNVAAVELRTVRSSADEARTRVVFDLSGRTSYTLFTLRNPDRVVIDFEQTYVNDALPAKTAGNLVRGVRYAPRGGEGLRLVLDVSHSVSTKDLQLLPDGPYGHRLVVDLFRAASSTTTTPVAPVTIQKPAPGAITVTTDSSSAMLSDAKAPVEGSILLSVSEPELQAYTSTEQPRESGLLDRFAGFAAGDSAISRMTEAINLDISGQMGAEGRIFFQDPRFNSQPGTNVSFSLKPEIYAEWDNNKQSLLFVPFARWDQHDSRRTHADLRELSYIYAARDWELRAGVRKVFWGVAESNHLIDIINQTDFIENIDFEDKLGQPMVNLALIRDWGTIDLFVLPGFRERTFPGRDGRFQGPLRISNGDAEYESAAENTHVDYAMRYSHYIGAYDIGVYHFWGTTREPRFGFKFSRSGEPILFPIYEIIHQTGVDLQATLGNWLLKFEGLRRQGQGDTFVATVGGFEYTFVGVFDTAMDVGVLGEYHWDERGKDALMPFNDDLFVGSRLAFNDAADSQVLGGMASDLNGGGHFINVEASRRIGEYWKVELEMRWFVSVAPSNPLFGFNRDDLIQVELLRSF